MSLPATCPFTGTDGVSLNGQTTNFFGGTGTLTFVCDDGTWQINGNRAYNPTGTHYAICNLGVSDQIVEAKSVTVNALNILVFRANSGMTAYNQVWIESNQIRVFDQSLNQIGTTYSATMVANDVIRVSCSGTAITVTRNGSTIITATSSTNQSNTYGGIRGAGSELFDDLLLDQFAVASPTATLTRATPTTAYLQGTSGTGGTSPQWSRSTSPSTGFVNLSNGSGISGATSDALVDASSGIAGGTRYYYKVTYTGSGASNVQSGGKWKTPAYVLFIGDSITAGFGSTTDPVTQFAASVKSIAGQRDVITVNAGASGTHAYEWWNAHGDGETGTAQAGSSTTITLRAGASSVDGFYNFCKVSIVSGTGSGQSRYIDGGASFYVGASRLATVTAAWTTPPDNTSVYQLSGLTKLLSDASAAGLSAGCTHAMSTLGVNDSFSTESTSEFQANLLGESNYLLSQGYTAVIHNYPTGFAYQGDGSLAKLQSLTANIDAIVNGTTILRGDTLMIEYLPDHAATEMQTSGTSVHPNEIGDRSIGDAWAFAWARAVGDVSSGGSGSVPMIGSPLIRSLQ